VTFLIVGGSSGVGRASAERFAAGRHPICIVSSDRRDSLALASDLSLRWSIEAEAVEVDLALPRPPLVELDAALSRLPPLRGILLCAGTTRADDRPGQTAADQEAITRVNYLAGCEIVNRYLPLLRRAGAEGLIVGFGSIAAARGRSRNAGYAAAKRALRTYFESLRHELAAAGVIVQFYTLGYIDTNLSFGHKIPLAGASPRSLAERVYRRAGKDFGHAYYPPFWGPVCVAVRLLPWRIFRRLSF